MITYGVCTRNNPQGLCSLLGSIVAATHRSTRVRTTPYCAGRLVICDSSDVPVITHSHLARLIPSFDLVYLRSSPGLVEQRRKILAAVGSGPVYFIDDDHVLVQDPRRAFEAAESSKTLTALFGASTDLHNDRGYKDYTLWSNSPESTHSLHVTPAEDSVVAPDLEAFSANAGNMLIVEAARVIPLYSEAARLLHSRDSGLSNGSMDDRLARLIATTSHLHHSLDAIHIGNSNNWWAVSHKDKADLTEHQWLQAKLEAALQEGLK